jgi:hypothetical protein
MNETDVIDSITRSFEGVTTAVADDNMFFFYDPDQMFPFATLMTNDVNDQFSNLDRPGVFRLNIGVGKETFQSLFGDATSDYDFTALDTIMPHPVYGRQRWICVLNPSAATFESTIQPLLAEAYERDVRKHARK